MPATSQRTLRVALASLFVPIALAGAVLPAPQRDHLSAYIQFLGVRALFAQAAS